MLWSCSIYNHRKIKESNPLAVVYCFVVKNLYKIGELDAEHGIFPNKKDDGNWGKRERA